MFGLFKSDPTKKLQVQYEELLEQAMQCQRKGDIKQYSELTAQAEIVRLKIVALKVEG